MFDYLKKLIFGVKKEENKPFNLYQYKFLRYKKEREKIYPLDISKVHMPCKKGMVSVILPVYNGADILAESVESVLCQTYTDFEFIIINDGSKDDTLSIAREYEKKDKRIRVLTQENRKIPRTLSRGFSEAKGEFLTWTSADNIMDKDFLEKMVSDMAENPQTAMVYANMRLIDAKGKRLRNHGWFEYPIGSGNVIFPENAFELNTYANNTIGAAFMYRAAAYGILGCYSSFKHTLEDYDYWMRMNSLLKLRHVGFREPFYSYRWHDKSLTARDAELGITKNRYKLMVLDDFRRDFYLTPLIWYVESDSNNYENAENFRRTAKKAGHIVIERENISDLFYGGACSSFCYVSFGGKNPEERIPNDAVKICVNCSEENKNNSFDVFAYLPENKSHCAENDRAEIGFDDIENMFSYLDAKAKNDFLYSIEERIESEKSYSKKLSVVLCTNRISETLKKCMTALCTQNASPEDYEIIFVNNDYKNKEIKELAQSFGKINPYLDISYITAPVKGLSYARNCGLWASSGEIILYIDDDAIADENLVTETVKGFEENAELGIIGGQIKLEIPEQAKEIVTENTVSLWSNLEIKGDKVRCAKDYGEFPYGANFAVRAQCLMQIGGFRCAYGRVGENFGGGEETLVCFMMKEINAGVGLNPRAIVMHCVAADRFTMQHIEKTVYSGIMTQYHLRRDLYAPADWNDINVRERSVNAEKKSEREEENSADFVFYKATAKAFRDVLLSRQKDYDFLLHKGK